MADDDVAAAERARLEAVAWGAGSTPAEAARARIALDDLAAGRRRRTREGRAATRPTSADGPAVASTPAPARRPSGRDAAPRVTDTLGVAQGADGHDPSRRDGSRSAGTDEPVAGMGAGGPDTDVAGPASARPAAVVTRHETGDVAGRHDTAAIAGWTDPSTAVGPGGRAADGALGAAPADAVVSGFGGGGDAARTGHDAEATEADGSGASLQAGWRDRVRDLLWTRRPRVWIVLGAAAAVGVAFAAGTVVGTARPTTQAAPSITPTAGAVTLEQLLDVPQTYADQLPGPVDAPVSLHTTRLVFTNRALDGGSLETPWNVWAGVGTDRSTICLVATADRIQSTTACYPREDALHGSVSLSAQSASGTLTLWLRGGGVQGTVTDSY